ncbi:MAG TPA: class I adenylate-forming enzyme family protein [Acidimicrobiia bacterium]|nr:class I adenylate-forming enzyme family protein [Acidimicrobiia bacterium]
MTSQLGSLLDHGDDDETVVRAGDAVTTRGELRERAATCAAALHDVGGRAIGVCGPNTAQTIATWFGVWQAGGAVVPLNPRAPESERERALAATGASAWIDTTVGTESGLTARNSDQLLGANVAIVQFTSGTTGAPKPVPLRHETVIALLDSVIGTLRGDRTARAAMPNLVPLPLSTWGGMYQVLFAFTLGVPVILMDHFEPQEFARLVREYQIRSSVLPPAALVMLLREPDVDLGALKYVRSVSAPLSPAHARKFHERFGVAILNGYGQTELGGEAIGWSAGDWKRFGLEKVGSVGRPHPAFDARIADDAPLGELEIRSTQPLPDDPDVVARITADGWLRTGDLAHIDDDNFVWIEGRVSAMINRGGLKVFPDEVEETLRAHPQVVDASVVAQPDERLGEVPFAFVIMQQPVADAELDEWCRARLTPYKVPVAYRAVETFPRNEAGKVVRAELVAQLNRSSPGPAART